MGHHNLDSLDKKILRLVSEDARIPFLEVARACNVSGAAIHQRVQKLSNLGIIKGSQFIIDPERIGYETCAYVSLYLKDPSDHDHVIEALRKIPEVVECHMTTGGMDLFIKLYARNNHHLVELIHDKLQPLGLSRSETIILRPSVANLDHRGRFDEGGSRSWQRDGRGVSRHMAIQEILQ